MANRNFKQFFYSMHTYPVFLDCNFVVGASGAVGTLKGPGISSVTKLATGMYQIKFQDNYNRIYVSSVNFLAPVTGSSVPDGSLVVGTTYQITAVGTTTWSSYGLASGLTAAIGQSFVATSIGGAGTGTAKAIGNSGIYKVEIVGDPNVMLQAISPYQGAVINIQCLDASGTLAHPANGCTVALSFVFSNSSVTVQGE